MKKSKRTAIETPEQIFSVKRAFLLSLIASGLLNAILQLGVFYGESRNLLSTIGWSWSEFSSFFLWHFCCNLLLFFLLFLLNFRIVKKQKKHSGWFIAIGTILICSAISPLLSQLQWRLVGGDFELGIAGFTFLNMAKDTVFGIIAIITTQYLNVMYKREEAIISNQKLKEENIQIKYDALKNQLDPHFLFNCLNALDSLICDDDKQAHDYLESLSSVYRYMLHSKNIVTVEEEMEFMNYYIALLKIRYGDNLRFDYKVDACYRNYRVLPASLQLLIENAVKHNVISNRSPLEISIFSSPGEGSITVCNPSRPKASQSIGGIGLANLSERHALVSGRDVVISAQDGIFSVTVPLMEPEK